MKTLLLELTEKDIELLDEKLIAKWELTQKFSYYYFFISVVVFAYSYLQDSNFSVLLVFLLCITVYLFIFGFVYFSDIHQIKKDLRARRKVKLILRVAQKITESYLGYRSFGVLAESDGAPIKLIEVSEEFDQEVQFADWVIVYMAPHSRLVLEYSLL